MLLINLFIFDGWAYPSAAAPTAENFRRSVARNAEYSRTGKRIPLNIIQEIEDFELDKDAEVEEVKQTKITLMLPSSKT